MNRQTLLIFRLVTLGEGLAREKDGDARSLF